MSYDYDEYDVLGRAAGGDPGSARSARASACLAEPVGVGRLVRQLLRADERLPAARALRALLRRGFVGRLRGPWCRLRRQPRSPGLLCAVGRQNPIRAMR